FKHRAVKAVRAGFRDQVHLTSHDAAVLSRQDAAHELNLLDGVDAHHVNIITASVLRDAPLLRVGIGVRSVDADPGPTRPQAVDSWAAAGSDVDSGRQPEHATDITPSKG